MFSGQIPNIFELWNVATLRVAAPKDVIFICGGPWGDPPSAVKSRRDIILRESVRGELKKFRFVRAESLTEIGQNASYKEFLTFEADIAQISALVLLFAESAGSFTELGAFAMVDDIADRLLVIVDDVYYVDDSFIKWGPIEYLEKSRGDESVFVLNRESVGMMHDGRVTDIDPVEFSEQILGAIKRRIRSSAGSSKFDPSKTGHVIRFLTGLLQDYGALTLEEMHLCAEACGLSIAVDRVQEYMTSAEFLSWVFKKREGFETYFAARGGREAIRYDFLPNAAYIDRARWRADVLAHWRRHEKSRARAIDAARALG